MFVVGSWCLSWCLFLQAVFWLFASSLLLVSLWVFLHGLRNSSMACLPSVVGCSLIAWPNQFNRLLLIVLLHASTFVRLYSFLDEIFLCHLIPIVILRSFLWNALIWFSKVVVKVHISFYFIITIMKYVQSKIWLKFKPF